MSGHSKWSTIKHKKGIADARKGAAFTKLANLIAVAARSGADPEMNFKLRLAIGKAKAASMPTANIERAIKKGSGQLGGEQVEEITYEGYGPGGVAVIVEVATDNRNRTAPEVRSAFTKYGGHMGETGSVAYQFDHIGQIAIKTSDFEGATLDAIDAGADDVETPEDPGSGSGAGSGGKTENGAVLVVFTAPTKLDAVRKQLADKYEIDSAELAYVPKSNVLIQDAKTAGTLMKLMDALDELDDVTATYANFDIPDSVVEEIT